ncbi:MAG: Asp-tRNAAsn/Glu-tRNAGln amidotransferase subunit and related amidase [Amycolatopsis sp.]|nr:Asp-tRNAAsn/Glu-tRNAGln amidotransferase subunit and related amidase [Amycolatopsis sp.]
MDDLWRWSATELATGIRTGQVSAEAAARSCLDRIAEVNPALNALSGISERDTLAAARHADQAIAAGEDVGPLHGVPVAVKINTEQTGHATSMGVSAFADTISDGDAFCVAELRAAGAIMLGRSNSPAFALRWFSTNDLHGRTLSPWDPGRTPGGSSGGAASALASGMVPLAQANDIGGSIRYPSYSCGVVGIRPTVGRMPIWSDADKSGMDSPLSFQCMAVHGPMARTVSDVRLAFDVMSTVDLRDPFSVPAPAARNRATDCRKSASSAMSGWRNRIRRSMPRFPLPRNGSNTPDTWSKRSNSPYSAKPHGSGPCWSSATSA